MTSQRTACPLSVFLESKTQRLAAHATDRPGLMHGVGKVLRACGLVPHDVSTIVHSPQRVDLSVDMDADDRALLRARAVLESTLGISFDEVPLSDRVQPRRFDTARLRLDADAGVYGPGSWLLIARKGQWSSPGPDDVPGWAAQLGEHAAEAFEQGDRGTLERLLCLLLGWNANLLFLEAAERWDGKDSSGINAVFHMPSFSGAGNFPNDRTRAAKHVLTGALNGLIETFGGTLCDFHDLDQEG